MFISNTTTKHLISVISEMQFKENEACVLLFGEDSKINIEQLIYQLNEAGITFFGGVFPGIIHGETNYKVGCIIKKLPIHAKPIMVHGLNTKDIQVPNFLKEDSPDKLTLLTFVDGLTSNISNYLKNLYFTYGNRANFLGGGAGSLTLVQKPCVFSNEGFFKDAAVICPISLDISLGVQHGWKKLKGPFVATKTKKNVIQELNWTKGFDVYKEIVEEDSENTFNDENFFDIAKGYPFGIIRENGEDIVRDPIAHGPNGELICVGEVPENSVLYIMKGENSSLINSAQLAVEESISNVKVEIQHTFIVDCISRTLFLEENFSKELEAISKHLDNENSEAIPQGILSLGEISSSGKGLLEFYNKTLVIGAFH